MLDYLLSLPMLMCAIHRSLVFHSQLHISSYLQCKHLVAVRLAPLLGYIYTYSFIVTEIVVAPAHEPPNLFLSGVVTLSCISTG